MTILKSLFIAFPQIIKIYVDLSLKGYFIKSGLIFQKENYICKYIDVSPIEGDLSSMRNVINLNNPPKIDLSKKKNESSNKNKDDNSKKEVIHKKEKAEEEVPDENNSNPKDNMNLGKRHRRGKCEISDRLYKCPECDKSYLSGPALTNHRRIKHKMVTENEKKSRGRPKKEIQQENSASVIQNKFSDFFLKS